MTSLRLASDCSSCFGLCCVMLPFEAGSEFGADKPAGVACSHLQEDRCGIHGHLRERGWRGCTVFECFGAGQQVSQVIYGGRSWQEGGDRLEMAAVFSVVRLLQEALAHLDEVARRAPSRPAELLTRRISGLVGGRPAEVLQVDVQSVLAETRTVLVTASRAIRSSGDEWAGRDLSGRNLRDFPLRGACLRSALLLGADLRWTDLTRTDFLGADLRGADLTGSDLSEALFLTQPQMNAAIGGPDTRLPHHLSSPAHWH